MKKLKSKSNTPWIKFYSDEIMSQLPLKYSDSSMVGYLLEAVARYPENIAYEFCGYKCTYRELYSKIKEAAKGLKTLGVKRGDKVSICMPNTPSSIIMFYAINMVGAIASMIHPLSAENEIENYLNESESTILYVLDLVYSKVRNIIDTTGVEKVIVGSVGDDLKNYKKLIYKYNSRCKVPEIELSENIMTLKEFLNYGYDYDDEIVTLSKPEDPAVILYSGGTSGVPKGVVLSNLNFNSLALQCFLVLEGVKPGDSILSILPIFHGFGLGVCIHTPLCCGMKLILIPNFNPKEFANIINKHQPNVLCAVPSLYESLIKVHKNSDFLCCVKHAVSGGDYMSDTTKKKIDEYFREHGSNTEIRIGYGLTEATAASCTTPLSYYKKDSVGIPVPDVYYKIVKIGSDDEVPYGIDGEICISGPTVMLGYINNHDATVKVLHKHSDGKMWLHTGDIGCMDDDGFVYYHQRLERMIVSNGYNLYPSHIENIINGHPDVLTSIVIGIPDPKKVQVAKAFIFLKDGVEQSKDVLKSIKSHCEINLARYSLPAEYEFIDSLPTTHLGKIDYKKLEKEHIDK